MSFDPNKTLKEANKPYLDIKEKWSQDKKEPTDGEDAGANNNPV